MARKPQRLVVGQQYVDAQIPPGVYKPGHERKTFYFIRVKSIDKTTRRPIITRLAKITRVGISKELYPFSGGFEFLEDQHLKNTYNKHEFIKFIYKKIDTEF